jgi:hypothetical protein
LTSFVFLGNFFCLAHNCAGNTNTGEGVRGKKVRTTSDDAGGKSVNEKSKSTGGKCVSENSTGCQPGVTWTSNNPFESSRREKTQYFVDAVKNKWTKNNNFKFLIGLRVSEDSFVSSLRIS